MILLPGDGAKVLFDNLRKKYSKEKNNLKKVQKSGTGSTDIERAECALAHYRFLSCFDAHIYIRKVKQISLLLMIAFLKRWYLKIIPTNLHHNLYHHSASFDY